MKYLLFAFFASSSLTSSYCLTIDVEEFRELNLASYQLNKILAFIEHETKDCAWIPEYPIVSKLINEMNLKIGCELGVAYAGQSVHILANTSVEKLYSIDPYQHFAKTIWNDGGNFEQDILDVMYIQAKQKLTPFGNRSTLLRETSEQANKHFENDSLDFVYIDANHAYEYVKQDLTLWFNKVRSGGLLIGDDYIVWPGVAQAVKEFTKAHRIQCYVKGNKWWFIKP